jgi:hypothetical protein
VTNVESFTCGTDSACEGATISVTDPDGDFQFECKGRAACQNVHLTIELTAASTLTELEAIKCDDRAACTGASFTIINNSPFKLTIEELDCGDVGSCSGASFVVEGTGGVSIEECKCGEDGGCDGATGLAAICNNIAATAAPDSAFASGAFMAKALESDTDAGGLLDTDGDAADAGDHVMISLSKSTLENLWALCGVVLLVNITLCVWCHCKRKGAAKQRFMGSDPYESEVNTQHNV